IRPLVRGRVHQSLLQRGRSLAAAAGRPARPDLGVHRGRARNHLYAPPAVRRSQCGGRHAARAGRSEEHTSELQSLMRISYAVFCLKKKKHNKTTEYTKI